MNERPVATAAEEISAAMRNRLIESRLTPNAISMVGLAGNIAAASGNMDDARAAWTRVAQKAPESDAGRASILALQGGDASTKP